MKPEIFAIFIPILFVVGLFTAISLNIYYKYKARVATADHVPGESIEQWHEADARAKAVVSRTAALRLGAFLTGAGIGTVVGMFVGRAESLWQFFGTFWTWQDWSGDEQHGMQLAVWSLFVVACAIAVGGLFMVVAYFTERAVDGRKKN